VKIDSKAALKKLQGLLADLKVSHTDETIEATKVAFMPNIRGALLDTKVGVFMVCGCDRPTADPMLADSPYLHYFAEALAWLGKISFEEVEAADKRLRRDRETWRRRDELRDLTENAKKHGFRLVKEF
jgi:hypothetical protein